MKKKYYCVSHKMIDFIVILFYTRVKNDAWKSNFD